MAMQTGPAISPTQELEMLQHRHALLSKEAAHTRDVLVQLLREDCEQTEQRLKAMQATIDQLRSQREREQNIPAVDYGQDAPSYAANRY